MTTGLSKSLDIDNRVVYRSDIEVIEFWMEIEMQVAPVGQTRPGFAHHRVTINGAEINYVSAGTTGSPILLVHGFPETWWTFHKVMPLLAERHRVFAVDLRGFGDSSNGKGVNDSNMVAADLHHLIAHFDAGPVHLTGQDIAGAGAFRLAAKHPGDVASFTAIEMGLAGFGLELLADVTHGGSWHIGVLAAPGIAEMLLVGHEQAFLRFMFASMSAQPAAVSPTDIEEFARSYSRPGGWRGAAALYRSMLRDGADIRAIVEARPLSMPVLAIGAGGGGFTAATMARVSSHEIRSVLLDGVGHYAAMEAPDQLATAMLDFLANVDASKL